MSLKIYVDHYDGTPVPTNTTLTGTIAVQLRKAEQRSEITQIQLVFYCRSKVDITRTRQTGAGNNRHTTHEYYHSKCILFSHSYTLTSSSFQPAASRRGEDGGTLHFPFSVHIPTHAEPVPPNVTEVHRGDVLGYSDMFPGTLGYDPPHAVQPPMPLPDTMLDFRDDVTNSYRVDAKAQVRYTLRAEAPGLSSPSKLWMGDAEEDCDIAVFNPVSFPTAPLVNYNQMCYDETIRTMRLLPSHGKEHRLSFRENMRSVFKKDKLPFMTLRLGMSVPDTLWLDSPADAPLPIFLNVQRLLASLGEIDPSASGSKSRSRSRSRGDDEAPVPPTDLNWDNKAPNAKSAYLAPPNQLPQQLPDGIPDPEVHLTRLTLTLTAHTSLRGNHPSPSSIGGQTMQAATSVRIFEWRASKSSPQIPLVLLPTQSTPPPPPPISNPASSTGNNSDVWLNIGTTLNLTTAHLHSAGQASGVGANSDGSLQGAFLLPNLAREWSVSWEVRVEVAGEEVRWRSEDEEGGGGGGGVGVRLLRGDGGFAGQQGQQQSLRVGGGGGVGGSDVSGGDGAPPEYAPKEDEKSGGGGGGGLREKMARLSFRGRRKSDEGVDSGQGSGAVGDEPYGDQDWKGKQ